MYGIFWPFIHGIRLKPSNGKGSTASRCLFHGENFPPISKWYLFSENLPQGQQLQGFQLLYIKNKYHFVI